MARTPESTGAQTLERNWVDQARRWLAANVPSRYSPELTDAEVDQLFADIEKELRPALTDLAGRLRDVLASQRPLASDVPNSADEQSRRSS